MSRELRPIAIHGIERFIDAGKAAEFVQLNRKTLLTLCARRIHSGASLDRQQASQVAILISELDAWARPR